MTSLETVLLRTTYPCCGGVCRIRVLVDVPRETFYRLCLKCRARWHVTRTMVRATDGMRVDTLVWDWTTRDGKPFGNPRPPQVLHGPRPRRGESPPT